MPLKILELGKQFRPGTSITYPPFKNGKYMEEYFYDYIMKHKDEIESDLVYIPIFWTNLQNHPAFNSQKQNYEFLLSLEFKKMPYGTKYFTVVQHDDGPQLRMAEDVLVFGACTGNIPIPLIYEDTTNKLLIMPRNPIKKNLASFVGTYSTHSLRTKMFTLLGRKNNFKFVAKGDWTNNIPENLANTFIETTLSSKFCLAPRGYGRGSFRFFEAMLLDTVPVYFWDDIEWLPYKEIIDYSKFAVSINDTDISKTADILNSISNEKYLSMLEEIKKVRNYFTLEGMSEYIVSKIKQ